MEDRSEEMDGQGLGRRELLRAAAGGFALAASGLFLPEGLEETAAREGALDGELGGRRGKDRRGLDARQRRNRGDKKDRKVKKGKKDEGQRPDGPPPQGHGPFRATALKVINLTGQPLDCTFFYRVKTGLDDYGLPVANGTHTIAAGDSFRSDPDRYRVGVLFRQPNVAGDYYADVRNVSFWYPRGGVTWGLDLNPSSGKIGGAFINEQDFAQGQVWEQGGIALERSGDSEDRIEWNLFVRPQPK